MAEDIQSLAAEVAVAAAELPFDEHGGAVCRAACEFVSEDSFGAELQVVQVGRADARDRHVEHFAAFEADGLVEFDDRGRALVTTNCFHRRASVPK